eukprot:1376038-Pyramimonas_sp.AAC.1
MVRARVPERFQKEWGAYACHLDSVLAFGYGHLRPKGFGLKMFCETYQKLIERVLPWDAVSRLLVAKGSWDGHEDDIEA